MSKIVFKKRCILSVFLALAQYCEGMDVQTYVFGTDETYIQPTVQAIYSLNQNTLGSKRIIVLETDDIYGKDEEAFSELSQSEGITLLRWKLSELTKGIDSDIQKAYAIFCKSMSDAWKNYETVKVRVLFPVLFDKDNLKKAGYLDDLGDNQNKQPLNHFVWLDSDIVFCRNLNDFYNLSEKLPINDSKIPQPTMSTDLCARLTGCKSVVRFQEKTAEGVSVIKSEFRTSGGVVFWNLEACRKLFPTNEPLIELLKKATTTEEIFIDKLLGFWRGKVKISYEDNDASIADQLFNTRPEDWLAAKRCYNLLKALDAKNKEDRDTYLNKVVEYWAGNLWDKNENYVKNNEKIMDFLKNVFETYSPENNKSQISPCECYLSKLDKQDKETATYMLKFLEDVKKNSGTFLIYENDIFHGTYQDLCDRLQYLNDTSVVLHWDGRLKPWNKVAKILEEKQIGVSMGNITGLLNSLVANEVLDPADTMWVNNLLSWMRADDINDLKEKVERQMGRQIMASNWLNSLMKAS